MPGHYRLRPDLPDATRQQLRLLATPRVACGPRYVAQDPHPKQAAFLCINAREAFFGGAAGPGKSSAVLMGAFQYVCVPGYRAILLRQTFPQLEGEDGLIWRAKEWLGSSGLLAEGVSLAAARARKQVHWNDRQHRLTFLSGATISFGHLQYDKDKHQYQGLAFHYVGFDELTHWPDSRAFTFVGFSRVRRPQHICGQCDDDSHAHRLVPKPGEPGKFVHAADNGCTKPTPKLAWCPGCGLTAADVPLRTRAGANPGARGHQWVRQRYIVEGKTHGRPFVPARIEDNPSLDKSAYTAGLMELDPVERARMLRGDWEVTEEGTMFQRAWFVDPPGQTTEAQRAS